VAGVVNFEIYDDNDEFLSLLDGACAETNEKLRFQITHTVKPRSYVSVGRHFSLRCCVIIGKGGSRDEPAAR
jgi:hypothetical protein